MYRSYKIYKKWALKFKIKNYINFSIKFSNKQDELI
jgi:hypothetical protein